MKRRLPWTLAAMDLVLCTCTDAVGQTGIDHSPKVCGRHARSPLAIS